MLTIIKCKSNFNIQRHNFLNAQLLARLVTIYVAVKTSSSVQVAELLSQQAYLSSYHRVYMVVWLLAPDSL